MISIVGINKFIINVVDFWEVEKLFVEVEMVDILEYLVCYDGR